MKVVKIILKSIVTLVVIGFIGLFALNFVNNYDNSKNDWRNYNIGFNFEDGLRTDFEAPFADIAVESLEDTIDDTIYLVEEVASNF